MKYWKKKIKYEYGFNIKKIKLKNEYGSFNIYIAYKTVYDNVNVNSIDVKDKIFKDPRDIWKYLRDNEVINNG